MVHRQYTLDEVAKVARQSVVTIRRRVADGSLRARKVSARLLVDEVDLLRWLQLPEGNKAA